MEYLLVLASLSPAGPQHPFTWRKADHFIRFEEEPTTMATELLYSLKSDPTTMGRVIGTNHEGKKVFEVRPSNELKLVDSTDLEEVRPYSIRIGQIHYEAPKDLFTKGDVVQFPSGELCVVEQVDTKSRNLSDLPKGLRRVQTEALVY